MISLEKVQKNLNALQIKYRLVEHLRPLFISIQSILERKEKVMVEIMSILEQIDQEAKKAFSETAERPVPVRSKSSHVRHFLDATFHIPTLKNRSFRQ